MGPLLTLTLDLKPFVIYNGMMSILCLLPLEEAKTSHDDALRPYDYVRQLHFGQFDQSLVSVPNVKVIVSKLKKKSRSHTVSLLVNVQ